MKRFLFLLAFVLFPSLANAQTRFVSATPTLDTAAYATGDSMHTTAMTFTRALRGIKGVGYLVSVTVSDDAAQPEDLELWLFSALPSSYGNANAAFDPTDAQLLTVVGIVSLGSSSRFAASDNAMKFVGSLVIPLRSTNADGNLYGVLVSRGAYNGDASSLTVTLGIAQE